MPIQLSNTFNSLPEALKEEITNLHKRHKTHIWAEAVQLMDRALLRIENELMHVKHQRDNLLAELHLAKMKAVNHEALERQVHYLQKQLDYYLGKGA